MEVADTDLVELAGQPLPPVNPDLDGVGQPCLDADVHEPELGIDQVQVVVNALALARTDLETMGAGIGLAIEGPGWLDDADHTDQSFAHPVFLDDGPGVALFGLARPTGSGVVQVQV